MIELIVIILLLGWTDSPSEQKQETVPTMPPAPVMEVPDNAVNTTTVTALAEVLTAITQTGTSTSTNTETNTNTDTSTGTNTSTSTATAQEIIESLNTSTEQQQ